MKKWDNFYGFQWNFTEFSPCITTLGDQKSFPTWDILTKNDQCFCTNRTCTICTIDFVVHYYMLRPPLQDSLHPCSYASEVNEKLKQVFNERWVQQGHHRYLLPSKYHPLAVAVSGLVAQVLCQTRCWELQRCATGNKVTLSYPEVCRNCYSTQQNRWDSTFIIYLIQESVSFRGFRQSWQ